MVIPDRVIGERKKHSNSTVELTNLFSIRCEYYTKSDSFRCVHSQNSHKNYRLNHKLRSKRLTNGGIKFNARHTL